MAISFSNAKAFGTAVCEALGIDAKLVARIVIDIDVNNPAPARIYVQMWASDRVLKIDWQQFVQRESVQVIGKDGA